jgi:DNA-binding GntR family transcriptional regulator
MASATERGKSATPARAPDQGSGNRRRRATYERIKQAILDGELKPGEPLVETALAEWIGVSRTPIREALTRLEMDGIALRSDRGLIVRHDSAEEVLDLYETRIALEATAARLAAERRTFHDLLQMRHLAEHLTEMEVGDPRAMADANNRFHQQVWHAAHNRSLLDLLDRLGLHLARYPATTLAYPGRWERANEQHLQIVNAIEERDGERAAHLAAGHFTESRDIRLKLWAEGSGA